MPNEKGPSGPPNTTLPGTGAPASDEPSPYAPKPTGSVQRAPYHAIQQPSPFAAQPPAPAVPPPPQVSPYAPPGLRAPAPAPAPPPPAQPPVSPYAPPGLRAPVPVAPPREGEGGLRFVEPEPPPPPPPPPETGPSPFARPAAVSTARGVPPPSSALPPPGDPLAPSPFARPGSAAFVAAESPYAPRSPSADTIASPAPLASHVPPPAPPSPPYAPPIPPPAPPSPPYAPPQASSPYAPPGSPMPSAAPYPPPPPPPFAPGSPPYAPSAAPYAPPPPYVQHPAPPPPDDAAAGMVLKRSLARAFRLRIEPDEVTPSEARALHAANVHDPLFMAFLAWRRAVLLLVAIALVPLTILRFVDAFSASTLPPLRFLVLIPAFAEGFLCAMCWLQLFNWTRWAKQRRVLLYSWLVFMVAPFLVFLIPVDAVFPASVSGGALVEAKIVVAMTALLTLAPKAVSLLAGALRAGIVSKLLFAGASGPGWLVVATAPLYTLFVFTLLIVPYQVTGSGWYFGAMAALLAAQIALGRAGYALAKPMTHEEAVHVVGRARIAYLVAMVLFAVCLLVALGVLAKQIGVETIFVAVLSFETNALILTLIGADLIITNLERARSLAAGTDQVADDTARKLESFARDA